MEMQEWRRKPADQLQEAAILALRMGDAATLESLAAAAAAAVAPEDSVKYGSQRAVLAALLEASARNLRLFRRVAGRHIARQDRSAAD